MVSSTIALQFDTLDALVEHEMERLQVPGVAVGILTNNSRGGQANQTIKRWALARY